MNTENRKIKVKADAAQLRKIAKSTVDFDEFGRSIYRQMLLQAAQQMDTEKITDLSEKEEIKFNSSFQVTVNITEPPSGMVGIFVGISMQGMLGEISYYVDVTDLSLTEPWWRWRDRVKY